MGASRSDVNLLASATKDLLIAAIDFVRAMSNGDRGAQRVAASRLCDEAALYAAVASVAEEDEFEEP